MHNEEDDDESESDSDVMGFSDEESDEAEEVNSTSENQTAVQQNTTEKHDDSIQIFEITSSSFHEAQPAAVEKKSNNKENTEASARKKKVPAVVAVGRFYATRQTDRKMRSMVGSNQKSVGKEKLQRRITKNIRKVVKTLSDQKPSSTTLKKLEVLGTKKIAAKNSENKPTTLPSRTLRKAPVEVKKESNDVIVRSLRSNSSSSNVMVKSTTRKRTSAFFENIERPVKVRRLK